MHVRGFLTVSYFLRSGKCIESVQYTEREKGKQWADDTKMLYLYIKPISTLVYNIYVLYKLSMKTWKLWLWRCEMTWRNDMEECRDTDI